MSGFTQAGLAAAVLAIGLTARAQPEDAPEEASPNEPRASAVESFHAPVRLEAAGVVIDSGESWGHSGPWVEDVDGDGRRDLIVGDFSGLFRVYRNVGTNEAARYEKAVNLQAGGEDAKVPIYCCIGSSPQFVDFDGDGILDLISGSYDPGELYLFRGRGKGEFAAREVIQDRSGKPILKSPDQREPVESFGSWATLVDWDDDGDLDLLVGTFEGLIFLRRNEGTRTGPAYATANEWLRAAGQILRVPGGEHANPVCADWDGDGLWDIITGAGDGGVSWYRNTGQPGTPVFDAPVTLVAKHEGLGYSERLLPGAALTPGIRSQIAVTDYDGDGKLDLLLGDFRTNLHVRADLTPEEQRALADLTQKENETVTYLRGRMDAIRKAFADAMKDVPRSERNSPENSAKWQAAYKGMKESPEYQRQSDELTRLQKESLKYIDRSVSGKRLGDDPAVAHGYVWLFRRK